MNSSPSIGALAVALADAQGRIQGAKKDSANPFFHSNYADLSSVWEACREALSSNGLSVIQSPATEMHGEPEVWVGKSKSGEDRLQVKVATKVTVTTRLLHSSGEWLEGSAAAILPFGDPQAVGSAITYLRRYALAAFVGVAPADDDGEGAMGRSDGQKLTRGELQERGRAILENAKGEVLNPTKKAQAAKKAAETSAGDPLKQAQRRTFAVLQRAGVLKLVDDPAAVLMPGDGGTFAREALRRKMMGDASFDKNKPADWLSWCLLLEKMVADNTPPTDVNEILA